MTIAVNNIKGKFELEVDYLIIAIGRTEQKDFYSENLLSNEKILIENKLLALAGDVKNGLFRQTSIAVGDGIKCAMEIYHSLKATGYEDNR